MSFSLKNMKNGNNPGCDGFTTLSNVFWNKIVHYVGRSIIYAYYNSFFCRNQKPGIITCIPKEDKPKHFL